MRVKIITIMTILFISLCSYSFSWTPIGGHITEYTRLTITESPYYLTAHLEVDSGAVLAIDPGVEINCGLYDQWGYTYSVYVCGGLYADGTEDMRIIFYRDLEDYNGLIQDPWYGISFMPSCIDEYCLLNNCDIINAIGIAIKIVECEITISNCLLLENDWGIQCAYPPDGIIKIENNTFRQSHWKTISCYGELVIDGNLLENNERGIFCYDYAIIKNNTITNTQGAEGIHCSYPSLVYQNNIYNNAGGIFYYQNVEDTINRIFHNNVYDSNPYKNLSNTGENKLNAQNNWWGSDPPDTTKFFGDINYTPWLTSPWEDTVAVDEEMPQAHNDIIICNNYPNPFMESTVVNYNILHSLDNIRVDVYNIRGQKIKTLVDNQFIKGGNNDIIWDGTDNNNEAVGFGIFFIKLETDTSVHVKKIVKLGL